MGRVQNGWIVTSAELRRQETSRRKKAQAKGLEEMGRILKAADEEHERIRRQSLIREAKRKGEWTR